MGYETDIAAGIAELLDAAGVAEWIPVGVYDPAGGPAIFIREAPDTDRPAVVLSTYPVASAWAPNDSVLGLQVIVRSAPGLDPRPADDLDSAIFNVLHARSGLALGGHRVTKVTAESGASLGKDQRERWRRSTNYYITGPR